MNLGKISNIPGLKMYMTCLFTEVFPEGVVLFNCSPAELITMSNLLAIIRVLDGIHTATWRSQATSNNPVTPTLPIDPGVSHIRVVLMGTRGRIPGPAPPETAFQLECVLKLSIPEYLKLLDQVSHAGPPNPRIRHMFCAEMVPRDFSDVIARVWRLAITVPPNQRQAIAEVANDKNIKDVADTVEQPDPEQRGNCEGRIVRVMDDGCDCCCDDGGSDNEGSDDEEAEDM